MAFSWPWRSRSAPQASAPVAATDGAPRQFQAVADGLQNVLAGLNTDRDKRFFNAYTQPLAQSHVELESMFRGSWISRRIVTTVADDMTREWVRLNWDGYDNDEESADAIERAERDFDVRGKTNASLRWARLYGGCVILVGIKGEADLSAPLDVEKLGKDSLEYLQVLDRWQITGSAELDRDLASPNFRLPMFYSLADASSDTNASRIHWSRVIRFNGQQLPYFLWVQNARWDDSELQAPLESVKNYDAVTGGVASMIFEANVDIIKAGGLADQLAMNDGASKVAKRFLTAATMKSFNRMLLLDKDTEEYQQKTTQFSGLNNVIQNFVIDLCGACDIPATRLFGQSPAGLTATGESDIRNYYDHVAARQETNLRPQLTRLYEILVRSALGKMPDDFQIAFEPLWQTSDKERAEIDKMRAETDQIYIVQGVLNEGAVARELKDRDTYRTLEDEDVKLAEELALQPDPVAPLPGGTPGAGGIPPAKGAAVPPAAKAKPKAGKAA